MPFTEQLTHTQLFVTFHTAKENVDLLPNFTPWLKTKWQLLHVYSYTAEVVERWATGLQSIACWLGNMYRMGLIPVFGSCLPRKQKPGGLLVLQAVGWRLARFR